MTSLFSLLRTVGKYSFFALLSLFAIIGITFAAARITALTQTAVTGDSITADWVNAVNQALAGGEGAGGLLKVYKNDGTTLLGYFVDYTEDSNSVPGPYVTTTVRVYTWKYADTDGNMQQAQVVNSINSGNSSWGVPATNYFNNTDCG